MNPQEDQLRGSMVVNRQVHWPVCKGLVRELAIGWEYPLKRIGTEGFCSMSNECVRVRPQLIPCYSMQDLHRRSPT